MKLILNKHRWYQQGGIFVTGFIRVTDRYLTDRELADFFSGTDHDDFGETLKKANGQFAVVVTSGDEVHAATDRLRSIPLFYHSEGDQFVIGDSACAISAELREFKIDEEAASAFLSTGYTLNDCTLVKGLSQVEAGEYIIWRKHVSRKYYHDYSNAVIAQEDRNVMAERLHELIDKLFREHLTALKDRFIAIPLSGGFDSRLIALMCKKYHPDNVLCFTYGRQANEEVAPAREIARRLELPWINIVYDSNLVKDFVNDGKFNDYYSYASEYSSMFFMQDYFAVKMLKDKNMLPDDTVFMPGHSGNFLAGEHITGRMKKTDTSYITGHVLNEHFILKDYNGEEKEYFSREIQKKPIGVSGIPWLEYENWDIKERQAKFIVNSASVFNYFGYSFVMPLWDKCLTDFFNCLPFEYKLNKNLYDQVLINGVFREYQLNLPSELNPTRMQRTFQSIKNTVKRLLPQYIVSLFISYQSPVLYDEIADILMNEAGRERFFRPHSANLYNSYLVQWYLQKVREAFKEKAKKSLSVLPERPLSNVF